ncbi:fibrocystin-L-like isoform X2 [Ruditapes philippinarum]|uniref:fibrocystin-L-like isoform X2 n=1 Tax=Ruditapes philippinarum TaxID=129788 RepID=UPI00295B5867|nr:fibrocystin-L-like isoform X2 [Ruditapes philippinarum]
MHIPIFVAAALLQIGVFTAASKVTKLSQTWGGAGGDVKITLSGQGFSANQFSYGAGQENLGNKVTLLAEKETHVCKIHPNDCTQTQIVCYTPKGLTYNTAYSLYVTVDGNVVTDICSWCTFTPRRWATPEITSITPFSGEVGKILLDMHGQIFTSVYGSNQVATNNILRLYGAKGEGCDPYKAKDEFYKLEMDSEPTGTNKGTIQCKVEKSFVGGFEPRIIITAPYGGSVFSGNFYRVSRKGVRYVVQSYTGISGISPSTGSEEGGTILRISGGEYDANYTYTDARVYVGDAVCPIIKLERSQYIDCEVPAKRDVAWYAGNRGALVETFDSSFSTYEEARDTTVTASGVEWHDETKYCAPLTNKWTRMRFIFDCPGAGNWDFNIWGDEGAKIYIDDDAGVETTGSTWKYAGRKTLELDQKVKMVVVGQPGTVDTSCVQIRAFFRNSTALPNETSNSLPEIQKLVINSTVQYENFTLKFTDLSQTTPVNTKQKVCIDGGNEIVRLGLYGAYTVLVDLSGDVTAIKTALDNLPFKTATENFVVARDGASCVDVTFESTRGNIPLLGTDQSSGYTVQYLTQGKSNNLDFAFQFVDTPGPLLSYDPLQKAEFAPKIQEALEEMLGVRCPPMFTANAKYAEEYTAQSSKPGETPTAEITPFCGRFSCENCKTLYSAATADKKFTSLTESKWLCLASRGLDNEDIRLKFSNKPDKTPVLSSKFVFQPENIKEDGEWKYKCIDVQDAFSNKNWGLDNTLGFVLVDASVDNIDKTNDFYVDEVFIGQTSPLATLGNTPFNKLRMPIAYPNVNKKTTTDWVSVDYNSTEDNYAVSIAPFDCGHDFNLLTLSESNVVITSNTAATSTLTDKTGKMVTTRTSQTQKPISGKFKITYNGVTSADIEAFNLTEEALKDVLETSVEDLGTLDIERSEDSTCANMEFEITLTDRPGDRPIMTVTYDLSQPDDAKAYILPVRDGYYYHELIRDGDILTYHTNPQVRVYINDVATKCKMPNNECAFSWSADATPKVTSLDKTTGSVGDTLTITGINFDANNTNNQVTIGGVICVVTSSSSGQLICTVGNGELGTHAVVVDVQGKGKSSGETTFTLEAAFSGITPQTSTLGGNINATLTGKGFSKDMVVKFGSVDCVNMWYEDSTTIYCQVPAYSDLTVSSQQQVSVKIFSGSVEISVPQTFTYTVQSGIGITQVSTTSDLTVHGQQTITIEGTAMGTNGKVMLGKTALEILSRVDTLITAKTPRGIPAGSGQPLLVFYGTDGAILQSKSIPSLDVNLELTAVSPTKGSLVGGTEVTLTGTGFGDVKDDVKVTIGSDDDKNECLVTKVDNQQILCDIEDMTTTYLINNEECEKAPFCFNKKHLEIRKGDSVIFSWKTPTTSVSTAFNMFETDSLESKLPKEGGFTTGSVQTKEGNMKHTFVDLGPRYILACDGNCANFFRMIIQVMPMESATKTIQVTVVGQVAPTGTSKTITKRASEPVDESGCSLALPIIENCDSEANVNTEEINFQFSCTRTPTISSISFNQADPNIQKSILQTTALTVNGDGFSSHDCANVAKIGDCPCTVTGSTQTSFTCTPDSSCNYETNVYQSFSVNVKPLGDAIFNTEARMEKVVVFIPSVISISPQSGSTQGGTEVTITGNIFTSDIDQVAVSFGGTSADCKYPDHHQIICTTPYKTLSGLVTFSVNIEGIEAKCETDSSCKYNYDPDVTSTVTAVDPTSISASSTLTFTGTHLGNEPNHLSITVAGEDCYNIAIVSDDTQVSCTLDALPAGISIPVLHVAGKGNAETSVTIEATPSAAISPVSGSIHGYTAVVFNGFGFVPDLTITVNDQDFCETLTYVSSKKVECLTKANGQAGTVSVLLKSNDVEYNTIDFEYSDSDTPGLVSITPETGTVGMAVVLSGSGLGTDPTQIKVHIGNAECTDVTFVTTDIRCNTGPQSSGEYDASVTVLGKGRSNPVTFKYTITITSFTPESGDINGGQEVTFSGNGLSASMVVNICGQKCNFQSLTSTTEYKCLTPQGTEGDSCSVEIQEGNNDVITATKTFSYNKGMSPAVEKIEPRSGGTKGGTQLTITGDRFSDTMSEVSVTIDGVSCVLTSSSTTQIVCTTGEHEETKLSTVAVTVNGVRATAVDQRTLQFNYADKWGSTSTWGGNPVPAAGEYVVIPAGTTVLLDEDTAVLEMLLIQGHVIFDEKDVTLKAKRVLIINGGSLMIGTEEAPFKHKGTIELYGDYHDHELPIYGTKVVAVRNGTLGLFGRPIENTWTLLSQTAEVGTKTISVQGPINGWQVGDEVVIATTDGHNSQVQTETGIIEDVSGNTITLENPLEYKHLGNTESYTHRDGSTAKVEYRAEVGLLSRNVKVIGKPLAGFDTAIEACPDGFDTGEFKTQTCFQGRFGDDVGSDQFGGTVMMHPEYPANSTDTKEQIVKGQFSYVEFEHVGQAFRLGRYPIHFHLMGVVSGSYVRGCSIHNTFNRAVNIHHSHNILVEYNVVHKVMGGALFLEDGIETGNILQYNLVLFVISSTSLLNDDITPASFWITNPNNTVRHNHAAGGTHFGYWFRMHEHPDGPSFTPDICPRRVVIGIFFNNTAHSFSWFGLWVFEEYYPAVEGLCKSEKGPAAAIIEQCTFWNNKKGMELVTVGAIHTVNLIAAQNFEANYEIKLVRNAAPVGALLDKALLIGQANSVENQNDDGITDKGIVFPFADDFGIKDTKFINYNDAKSVCIMGTSIDGTCSDKCGAYKIETSQLLFENAPNRLWFRWLHETVIKDLDGSLCNTPYPQIIVPTMNTLPGDKCRTDCSAYAVGSTVPPSNCDTNIKFTRFGFDQLVPSSVWGKKVNFVTTFSGAQVSVESYFRDHRVENKNGWMALLQVNETHSIEFTVTEAMINISFVGRIHDMDPYDCLMLKVKLVDVPDKVSVDNGVTNRPQTESPLDCSNPDMQTGDWYYEDKETFGYAVIAFVNRGNANVDINVNLKVVKCFFENCITPTPAYLLPPPTERPSEFQLWADATIWKVDLDINLRNASKDADGTNVGPPEEDQDVIIEKDMWVVISKYNTPRLGVVTVLGGLEIDYEFEYNYIFSAKIIIVKGGRFHVGWLNNPIQLGTVNIVLLGTRQSPPYVDIDGVPLSNKAIGVYGGLEMIGKDVVKSWMRLAESVSAGATVLKVRDDASALASWKANDRIFITSTSTNKKDLEVATIKVVNAASSTITLESAVTKRHSGGYETVDGQDIDLGAAVGLLSRLITVEGEVINNDPDAWGGRMLVSVTSLENDIVSGYARLHNVLFRNMGQDGFREDYDPRHAVSYVNTMFNASNKPSEVYNCAFEDIYNAAIGVIGTKDLTVKGNVVLKALGSAIVTTSENTTLKENLIANTFCSAAFDGRKEEFNLALEYAIEAISSKSLQMHDNYVCGSERIGYHVPGIACDATEIFYSNNFAVGNLIGAAILPDDKLTLDKCVKLSGFTVFKNFDVGLYYHNTLSLVASDNIYSDENTGIFPMVIGPNPLTHEIGGEYAEVKDSIVIGTSSVTNCNEETEPSGDYIDLSSKHRSSRGPNSERLGLLMAVFTGGKNNCPIKPCFKIMVYNAISGQMRITGVTFVNFKGESNGCKAAFAIATLKKNDDANHPVLMSSITKQDVDTPYSVLIHRPNVDKINSADCVDMDCDALKKVLLKDLDGSFLGQIGSVISESEFQWDGEDRRRGLGDYRIPNAALIDENGVKVEVDDLAPAGRGIVRTDSCKLITVSNNAAAHYWCPNLNYEMMLIESFDADTETRRLGPTAFFSGNYVDLMNGPQDHGWCNGYTCLKRISTFIAMILDQTPVDIYFSSTQPDHIRFALIRADPSRCAVVGLYYLNPNRIDVYKNTVSNNDLSKTDYILPKNGEYDTNGNFKLKNEQGVNYKPTCSDLHGANYIDREAHVIYFVVKGGTNTIHLKRADVIVVAMGFPAIKMEDFFKDDLIVNNIAALLGIPIEKIRVLDVVSESSVVRRRRSTEEGGITVTFEIGDEPTDTVEDDTEDVSDHAATLMNACQTASIGDSLNVQTECDEIVYGDITYKPTPPAELRFYEEISPQHEGVPFSVQPKIRAFDKDGNFVEHLGIEDSPWEITATLRSCSPACGHANAVLTGTLTVPSSNGYFNFTDLQISHKGDGYIIDFAISSPANTNLTVESVPFSVDGLPMTAGVYSMTSGDIPQDSVFALTLDLRDSSTNIAIPDITWRDHTAFDATCNLVVESQTGQLSGTLSKTFDSATGRATFDDLVFSGYGLIHVSCHIVSSPIPVEYDFYSFHQVFVLGADQAGIEYEASENIVVKYNLDYDKTLPTTVAATQLLQATVEVFTMTYTGIVIRTASISKGSIIISFTIEGKAVNITTTKEELCAELSSGFEVTVAGSTLTLDGYMKVDGVDYYATCGKKDDDDDGLHPAYIALIVVLCLIVIGIVVFVLVWRFKIRPKSKTHGIRRFTVNEYPGINDTSSETANRGGFYYIDNGRTVFLGAPNQKVQDILYKQKADAEFRSNSSAPITTLYDEIPGKFSIRSSPLPPKQDEDGARGLTPTDL